MEVFVLAAVLCYYLMLCWYLWVFGMHPKIVCLNYALQQQTFLMLYWLMATIILVLLSEQKKDSAMVEILNVEIFLQPLILPVLFLLEMGRQHNTDM